MRIRCIACEALSRIVYQYAAQSTHTVDVELMRLGLHNDPADLRSSLQQVIDSSSAQTYGAVVLAYGLCGKSTVGLRAPAIPLVIPRAHDCITLYLGSRERYTREFTDNPGTYWYSADYLARGGREVGRTLSMGNADQEALQKTREEFIATYGAENADYLMEAMGAWSRHYKRAAFIAMGIGEEHEAETQARSDAQQHGWTFDTLQGDLVLIRKLLHGTWDGDFLVVPPDSHVAESYDHDVVRAADG